METPSKTREISWFFAAPNCTQLYPCPHPIFPTRRTRSCTAAPGQRSASTSWAALFGSSVPSFTPSVYRGGDCFVAIEAKAATREWVFLHTDLFGFFRSFFVIDVGVFACEQNIHKQTKHSHTIMQNPRHSCNLGLPSQLYGSAAWTLCISKISSQDDTATSFSINFQC